MEKWRFATDNNNLIKLVIQKKKTATSYLYKKDDIPTIDEESIICFDNKKEACLVKTTGFKIMKFKEMTEELAKKEGEGDLSLNYWKEVHYNFFKEIDCDFTEDSKIIYETFELVKIYNIKDTEN